jgi:hypothetical protein
VQGEEWTKNTQSPREKDGDCPDEEGCTDLRSMVFITFCMALHCIRRDHGATEQRGHGATIQLAKTLPAHPRTRAPAPDLNE